MKFSETVLKFDIFGPPHIFWWGEGVTAKISNRNLVILFTIEHVAKFGEDQPQSINSGKKGKKTKDLNVRSRTLNINVQPRGDRNSII